MFIWNKIHITSKTMHCYNRQEGVGDLSSKHLETYQHTYADYSWQILCFLLHTDGHHPQQGDLYMCDCDTWDLLRMFCCMAHMDHTNSIHRYLQITMIYCIRRAILIEFIEELHEEILKFLICIWQEQIFTYTWYIISLLLFILKERFACKF